MDLDGQWTWAGELIERRSGHNVIYDGQNMMIIGDSGQTEKCLVQDGLVSCTLQEPELINYESYPELFLVSDGFCK